MHVEPVRIMGGFFSRKLVAPPVLPLTLRGMEPDGKCFDANNPVKFDDIYYESLSGLMNKGEKQWLADDTLIDKQAFPKLPKRGKDGGIEWGTPFIGKQKGRRIKVRGQGDGDEYDVDMFLFGKKAVIPESIAVSTQGTRKEFPPWFKPKRKLKPVIVWEDTKKCPEGKVRINYAGGVAHEEGLDNGKEKIHTYHAAVVGKALAYSKRYQDAAKDALCEVPPVKLICTKGSSGSVPKCEPEEPVKPPLQKPITWQLAMQAVGGTCKPDENDNAGNGEDDAG